MCCALCRPLSAATTFTPRSRRVCLRRVCAALMCSDRRAPVADAPPPARRGRHAHLQRRAAQCSASGCPVRPSAASARRGANTATNGAARRVCRGRRAARVVELRQRESNIRNTGTEYPEGANHESDTGLAHVVELCQREPAVWQPVSVCIRRRCRACKHAFPRNVDLTLRAQARSGCRATRPGPTLPHLHQDWAHPSPSARGVCSPLPRPI